MSTARLAPAVLAVAILGISISGPLVRLTDAPAIAVAVGRLAFSLPIVLGGLLATGSWRELRTLDRRDLLVALAAGASLALHFWSWITSLALTSVAASVVLVNLHPVVVALGSALWLRERPHGLQVAGIGLGLLGAAVIAVGDGQGGRGAAPLRGDLLAGLGAVTVALYFLAGRRLRQRLGLWPYVTVVYGACLLVLLGIAAVTRTPLFAGPPRDLAVFAAMAAGPMLLGHTGFNWALGHLPAWAVSLAVLGEPIGATLLAWFALGERPDSLTLMGGGVVLAGLALAALRPRGTAH